MNQNVLALLGKVSASALAVYVGLIKHAKDKGHCFPSQNTLATECGLSRRTVSAAIAELEADWINVGRTKRSDGTWAPNVYQLPDISGWVEPDRVQNVHNNLSKSPELAKSERGPLAKTRLPQGYVGVLYGRPGPVPEHIFEQFCPGPKIRDLLEQALHNHNGSEFLIVDRHTGEVVAELDLERHEDGEVTNHEAIALTEPSA